MARGVEARGEVVDLESSEKNERQPVWGVWGSGRWCLFVLCRALRARRRRRPAAAVRHPERRASAVTLQAPLASSTHLLVALHEVHEAVVVVVVVGAAGRVDRQQQVVAAQAVALRVQRLSKGGGHRTGRGGQDSASRGRLGAAGWGRDNRRRRRGAAAAAAATAQPAPGSRPANQPTADSQQL